MRYAKRAVLRRHSTSVVCTLYTSGRKKWCLCKESGGDEEGSDISETGVRSSTYLVVQVGEGFGRERVFVNELSSAALLSAGEQVESGDTPPSIVPAGPRSGGVRGGG